MRFKPFFCGLVILCIHVNLGCLHHTPMKDVDENICNSFGEWKFYISESLWWEDSRFQNVSYITLNESASKGLKAYLKKLWSSGVDYVPPPPQSPFFDKKTGAFISFMNENEGPFSIETENGINFTLRTVADEVFIDLGRNNKYERQINYFQFKELCDKFYYYLINNKSEVVKKYVK